MAATSWRGRLAFGLVSIPVRLYPAARRERIKFHHVLRQTPSAREPEPPPEPVPEPPRPRLREVPRRTAAAPEPEPEPQAPEPAPVERVRNVPVRQSADDRVEPAEILKGFEYDDNQYVVLEPEEVAALRPRTSSELEIVEFVKLEEIDPVYFDASYFVAPDRNGEKPYALLFEALRRTGYAALGTFAMHGREHAATIRTGKNTLMLHTLFYANEIRASDEYHVDGGLVAEKEVEMAAVLVRALAAKFDPTKFKDTFQERVRELIEARAQSGLSPDATAQVDARRVEPAVDLLAALRKSLEMARKPAGRAESTETRPRRRRARE